MAATLKNACVHYTYMFSTILQEAKISVHVFFFKNKNLAFLYEFDILFFVVVYCFFVLAINFNLLGQISFVLAFAMPPSLTHTIQIRNNASGKDWRNSGENMHWKTSEMFGQNI